MAIICINVIIRKNSMFWQAHTLFLYDKLVAAILAFA